MEFHPNDWLGRWQNFESYITSTDPYLQLAWQEAEAAAAARIYGKNMARIRGMDQLARAAGRLIQNEIRELGD